MRNLITALLLGPLTGLLSAQAPVPAFQPGERWCVLGDSITEGGSYHRYMELFYCTRFPDRKLEVVNCGIRGDTAPGALRRLRWDCLAAKPTVVSVMLGMNDVAPSLYNAKYSTSSMEGRRSECAETYHKGMRNLTASLIGAGVKVILIKPSIFDDTADLPFANSPGCGATLAGFASRVQAIAEESKVAVVDFSGPMMAINAQQQKHDPHFSIVGPDRTHPTPPGHRVMAYEFLRAQKASGVVRAL